MLDNQQMIDLLTKTREKITPPEAWTTDMLARDGEGDYVGPLHEDAVSWCVMGAIVAVSGEKSLYGPDWSVAFDALTPAAKELGHFDIVMLNNHSDHSTVLQALDMTIERLKVNA